MGQQRNKVEKRARRKSYLKRQKTEAKTKKAATPAKAAKT